jgi:N-methylhydantoinase B
MEQVVKDILAEYRDNPGINEDDMFICNDPYVGAMHQSDVAVVAPVYWKGELIAWTGSAIHQVDVGGPGRGQVSVGATSIYEEAPVIPPLKIVEAGVTRKDIEREYLKRSRLPGLLGLDLRAMIASNNVAKRRIKELIELRGVDTIKAVVSGIIDYTETKLRSRLRELPDGTWRHISYLDYGDKVYPCHLQMTKEGDELTLDFNGTAAQAPAVINCTYAGLRAGVLTAILEYLCYDIGWCPSGAMRTVKLISEEGTVVNARWPAGACKATTAGNWAVINLTSVCLAKVLAASDKYRHRTMATWKGSSLVEELFGTDQRGVSFGATILDFMAGGAGARSYKDGMDTGGLLASISCAIGNAETYELRYPILYLYRRQQSDTGGPGKFRGGAALGIMYIAHKVEEIPHKILHGLGMQQPESIGICGGYPGSTNQVAFRRDSNVLSLLKEGKLPAGMDEIKGEFEVPPQIVDTSLKSGDVYSGIAMGGGGYGDPIERDAELVLRDVANNLVSQECAAAVYGVVIDSVTFQIDREKTEKRRFEIKQERQSWQR